jgi:hypothetical protein
VRGPKHQLDLADDPAPPQMASTFECLSLMACEGLQSSKSSQSTTSTIRPQTSLRAALRSELFCYGLDSWIALFNLSLLLIVLTDSASLIARAARIGWLGEWGRISYCIYLIHAAVKYFCTNRMAHNATQITLWRSEAAVMLSVVITFGIAKLSWTFFESLLLRQGHRYKY